MKFLETPEHFRNYMEQMWNEFTMQYDDAVLTHLMGRFEWLPLLGKFILDEELWVAYEKFWHPSLNEEEFEQTRYLYLLVKEYLNDNSEKKGSVLLLNSRL